MKYLSLHEVENTQGTVQLIDRESLGGKMPGSIGRGELTMNKHMQMVETCN